MISSSNISILGFGNSLPSIWNHIIEDMLLVIQYIVAGTKTISYSVFSENYLQCKIHLSEKSLVISLQHDVDCVQNLELVDVKPLTGYKLMNRNNGEFTMNKFPSCCVAMENKLSFISVKQEIPEMLSVLCSPKENGKNHLISSIYKNELIDDLLIVIQCIVAGTLNIPKSLLSDNCLQFKIRLPEKCFIIMLQYELDSLSNLEFIINDEHMNSNGEEIKVNDYWHHEKIKQNSSSISCNSENMEAEKCNKLLITSVNNVKECKVKHEITQISNRYILPSLMIAVTPNLDFMFQTKTRTCKNTAFNEILNHSLKINTVTIPPKQTTATEKFQSSCDNLTRNDIKKVGPWRTRVSEGPYSCKDLDKSFVPNCALMRHRRLQTRERHYICEICGKSFKHLVSLSRHKKGYKRGSFSCDYCGRHFFLLDSLISHKQLHLKDRPFTCKDCGKSFLQSATLLEHQQIHTGERPYSCAYCERTFTNSYSLIYHQTLSTHHRYKNLSS